MTPGSAVRLASVARHVTDCATRPGMFMYCTNKIKFQLISNSADPDEMPQSAAFHGSLHYSQSTFVGFL